MSGSGLLFGPAPEGKNQTLYVAEVIFIAVPAFVIYLGYLGVKEKVNKLRGK